MGDRRKAESRKSRAQRPNTGSRKAAGSTRKQQSPEKENTTRLKPKPLTKKQSMSSSDVDTAELLIGLGTARNPMDKVFDTVMGISPEESAAIDAEQYGGGSDDESDGQAFQADDHSDSKDEEYTIVYKVPFHNATQELKLSCTTTFVGFLTAVLRKMEVGVTHLSAIGYVALYKPKNPKPVPKLLETSEDYKSLMADITEYRKYYLKKKGGGGGGGRWLPATQPAAPLEASEQHKHELMAAIEKYHACQEHMGKACYVLTLGEHYQYMNNDLVIWATLIWCDLATVDTVPDQLKVEDKINKQKRAKNAVMQTQLNGGCGPMWLQMQMPPWMYGMPPWMMQAPGSGGISQLPVPVPSPSPPCKRKYPAITAWLQALDSNEDRGADGQNYKKYADTFSAVGIIQLDDLLNVESVEKLQELMQMNWGTAKQLIKFAQEDCKKKMKAHVD
ncbi:hypothetical protein DFH08DRAFT_823147 [Mycena albidolilacea]|uniref:SAM domain-containing protein n=1 Tax=Mycena albidolilacea TaxID=1033008 RepID=A0AAD6Z7M9_9AGAR|nr:hypothetical protein DFH08DRAFT_823147 [Mycena albidolilacea]